MECPLLFACAASSLAGKLDLLSREKPSANCITSMSFRAEHDTSGRDQQEDIIIIVVEHVTMTSLRARNREVAQESLT